MRIVFHCGVHRTGSTFLQRYLAGNRSLLAEQGIRYPGQGVHHQDLAWSILRGESGAQDILELAGSDQTPAGDTVVLSAEDFARAKNLAWLRDLARDHTVEALFYLRRQDHWVMSWYNQHIKWPFERKKSQMDPRAFLSCMNEFYWIDYNWLLKRWRKEIGREAIGVGVIERGGTEDVLQDFAERLGIDASGFEPPKGGDNAGLPVHALEICRHLNMIDLPPRRRARLLRSLSKSLPNIDPSVRTVYSPDERRRILSRFAESNAAVAQEFLGRSRLFQEPEPAPTDPYYVFPDTSNEELMRTWVRPIVHDLLKDTK